MAVRRPWSALVPSVAVAISGLATPLALALAQDDRPSVRSVRLVCRPQPPRAVLVLKTRLADAERGDFVEVYRRLFDLDTHVFAKPTRAGRWVITPGVPGGRELLRILRRQVRERGEARIKTGVLAATESGGREAYFTIAACNERTLPRIAQD